MMTVWRFLFSAVMAFTREKLLVSKEMERKYFLGKQIKTQVKEERDYV